MLYHFLYPLAEQVPIFNLFKYLTFRAGGAALTALVLALIFGAPTIRWLRRLQGEGQPIRSYGPESHTITKVGTPTMGGVLVLGTLTASLALWGNWSDVYLWAVMLVTLGFGAIGFWDDYMKICRANPTGVRGKVKFLIQCGLAISATALLVDAAPNGIGTHLLFPFFKNAYLELGWLFFVFTIFVIVGSGNAVNLTDGLDGLATGPAIICAACFAVISYIVGNALFAEYLQLTFIPGTGELAVLCAALVGACLGFLWFNAPPASVFMGDTGSLAIGGALGTVAVATKHEIVLAIIGGLFVIETISVIVQVLYFKWRRERILLMAPLHHHFEKKGWAEETIVIRFWIIAIVLGILGLATLKIR